MVHQPIYLMPKLSSEPPLRKLQKVLLEKWQAAAADGHKWVRGIAPRADQRCTFAQRTPSGPQRRMFFRIL
jgi:hypothetical protein